MEFDIWCPRTPELPPQHELAPSLRDLPPLKLEPNPKARPWTTKRQLDPTPEEVDAVEVAKRQAHTRLVMGYAPSIMSFYSYRRSHTLIYRGKRHTVPPKLRFFC